VKKAASPPAPDAAAADAAAYAAFDHLATMVAVVSPQGRCIFANASFENVLGLSRRSVQRGSLFDWFVDAGTLRETVAAVARNEFSTSRMETLLRRPGPTGGDALPVHAIVTQMDGTPHVLLELVEIEQQTRQDREERALDQAKANKELIRNLAHEIKNPLGGIRGAAQLLEMEVESRALTEYTQVIINEADRLQDLMQRLLSSHRVMQPAQVNIHEILERVRRLIHAEYAGVRVRRDYDTSLPMITADREQMIQAILNIARNAAQAMHGEGEIVLRTRAVRQVTIAKKRFRLALELRVIDNGPGIPEAIRDKIFYPLVSGREGGSGLGLTLVQSFIHQHQGTIEVESRPGHTSFNILLPLQHGTQTGEEQ
jgi:two-component system nitrogen regulation sensor histidine kinase GlnL